MGRFGFCGPAYQSVSVNADSQVLRNMILEQNESGAGKSQFQLIDRPGTKTFARLYDDIAGLVVSKTSYQGLSPALLLPLGDYYAALALIDANGICRQRSRVFGPLTILTVTVPHSPPLIQTFAAHIGTAPTPGSAWYIYFGTSRSNLNQRLPLGAASPITSGGSFLAALPTAPDYIVDPAMGYVIGANGLQQPVPGTGPSWYVLLNGPLQGDQSASITIPTFDTSHSNFSVGVLARARGTPQALTAYYEVGLSASNPQIAIYRVVNGVVTVLASQASIAIPDGSVVTISVTGTTIAASLNGVAILTVVDAVISTGTTGFITTGPAISTFISSTTPSALSLTVTAPGVAATLPDCDMANKVPKAETINGRAFTVTDKSLWEVFADGYGKYLGAISQGSKSLAVSGVELVVAAGGSAYLYKFSDGTLNALLTDATTQLQAPVLKFGYSDGYFIALLSNGEFQISGIFDGSTWNPLDIDKVSVFADDPIAMIIDHREIVIAGPKQGIGYYDSGNPLFPFDIIPGSFAENGVGAPDSLVKADNSFFWIDADERGAGIARRSSGATPVRISTFPLEHRWAKYPTIADATGYSLQMAGHTFVVFQFPSADETWVLDVASGTWAEWTRVIDGKAHAHRSMCHFYAFGKHLLGDSKTGTIYEASLEFATDDGSPIIRDRIAPHIAVEREFIDHYRFELETEVGLGPQPVLKDGAGEPRNPQAVLRWSDDGGHTWSNGRILDLGKAGEYKKRVIERRLGRARDRVYWLRYSDPVPLRIIDAYINEPTERTESNVRKGA